MQNPHRVPIRIGCAAALWAAYAAEEARQSLSFVASSAARLRPCTSI
jgi:hypothetical protein